MPEARRAGTFLVRLYERFFPIYEDISNKLCKKIFESKILPFLIMRLSRPNNQQYLDDHLL